MPWPSLLGLLLLTTNGSLGLLAVTNEETIARLHQCPSEKLLDNLHVSESHFKWKTTDTRVIVRFRAAHPYAKKWQL